MGEGRFLAMLFINPKWTFLGSVVPNTVNDVTIGPTPVLPVCRFLHIDGVIAGYTGIAVGRIRPGVIRSVTNKVLTGNVATLTCATHQFGFTAGAPQSVTVFGVDSTFDGTYPLTAVSAGVSFSYAKTATNVASTAVTGGFVAGADRRWRWLLLIASTRAYDYSDYIYKLRRLAGSSCYKHQWSWVQYGYT